MTLPSIASSGTAPKTRLSVDIGRLSPAMK
jgi:hypothetical protein